MLIKEINQTLKNNLSRDFPDAKFKISNVFLRSKRRIHVNWRPKDNLSAELVEASIKEHLHLATDWVFEEFENNFVKNLARVGCDIQNKLKMKFRRTDFYTKVKKHEHTKKKYLCVYQRDGDVVSIEDMRKCLYKFHEEVEIVYME